MNYFQKYLKYKNKYLELKTQLGGTETGEVNFFVVGKNISTGNPIQKVSINGLIGIKNFTTTSEILEKIKSMESDSKGSIIIYEESNDTIKINELISKEEIKYEGRFARAKSRKERQKAKKQDVTINALETNQEPITNQVQENEIQWIARSRIKIKDKQRTYPITKESREKLTEPDDSYSERKIRYRISEDEVHILNIESQNERRERLRIEKEEAERREILRQEVQRQRKEAQRLKTIEEAIANKEHKKGIVTNWPGTKMIEIEQTAFRTLTDESFQKMIDTKIDYTFYQITYVEIENKIHVISLEPTQNSAKNKEEKAKKEKARKENNRKLKELKKLVLANQNLVYEQVRVCTKYLLKNKLYTGEKVCIIDGENISRKIETQEQLDYITNALKKYFGVTDFNNVLLCVVNKGLRQRTVSFVNFTRLFSHIYDIEIKSKTPNYKLEQLEKELKIDVSLLKFVKGVDDRMAVALLHILNSLGIQTCLLSGDKFQNGSPDNVFTVPPPELEKLRDVNVTIELKLPEIKGKISFSSFDNLSHVPERTSEPDIIKNTQITDIFLYQYTNVDIVPPLTAEEYQVRERQRRLREEAERKRRKAEQQKRKKAARRKKKAQKKKAAKRKKCANFSEKPRRDFHNTNCHKNGCYFETNTGNCVAKRER